MKLKGNVGLWYVTHLQGTERGAKWCKPEGMPSRNNHPHANFTSAHRNLLHKHIEVFALLAEVVVHWRQIREGSGGSTKVIKGR